MRVFGIVLSQTDLWLLGVVGTLSLALIGYYLSNALNRRSDFNKAADIMAAILRKERSDPIYGSNIDFSDFRRVLSGKELIRFDKCIQEYQQAKENTPIDDRMDSGSLGRVGSISYQDATSIVAAIDELLKFTDRK